MIFQQVKFSNFQPLKMKEKEECNSILQKSEMHCLKAECWRKCILAFCAGWIMKSKEQGIFSVGPELEDNMGFMCEHTLLHCFPSQILTYTTV